MASVALITGASAGLGEDFARLLSAQGHRLILSARRKDRLDALADELGNARAIACDLSQPGAADRLLAEIADGDEEVATLINNAGFGLWGEFAKSDPRQLRSMIDLNCGALTDLVSGVVDGMIERKAGAILNVASTAAFQPGPRMAVYFATKAYVLSLSQALHEELKPHGIKVSCLCPGPTRTEFGDVAGFKGNGAFDRISADSRSVVRAGLEGLERNKAIVIPGALNKVSAQSSRFLPRSWIRKIVAGIKY